MPRDAGRSVLTPPVGRANLRTTRRARRGEVRIAALLLKHRYLRSDATHDSRAIAQLSFSKTIVAWIRSLPPNPPLFADAVVIVCSRYPFAACLLSSPSSSERFPDPVPRNFSLSVTWITTYSILGPPPLDGARFVGPPLGRVYRIQPADVPVSTLCDLATVVDGLGVGVSRLSASAHAVTRALRQVRLSAAFAQS